MPNPQNPVFPFATAQDIDLLVASNAALSQLTLPLDGSSTSFTVVDGSKFEVPCVVQIDTEVIRIGIKSGNLMQSCTRGFSSTAPAVHGQNADVKGYVLSYHHNQTAAEIKAIEAALGANLGNVVTQLDQAGGEIGGVFSNLYIQPNGVTAGTYGGFGQYITISVSNEGRVSDINNATGNINYPIIYKAAIAQGANAVLGFSFGNTNAPNVEIIDGLNGTLYAVCSFTQTQNYWVQDHFWMPDDWAGDVVSLDVYWNTSAVTGTVTWNVQVAGIRDTASADPSFSSVKAVTTAVPATAYQTVKTTITPLPMSFIQAGDELFFKFARDAGDTAAAEAHLISLRFNIHRNFAV